MPAKKQGKGLLSFFSFWDGRTWSIDVNNLGFISLKSPLKMIWYWIKCIYFHWDSGWFAVFQIFWQTNIVVMLQGKKTNKKTLFMILIASLSTPLTNCCGDFIIHGQQNAQTLIKTNIYRVSSKLFNSWLSIIERKWDETKSVRTKWTTN